MHGYNAGHMHMHRTRTAWTRRAARRRVRFTYGRATRIDEVLGTDSERARLFKRHYHVKPAGNADLSPRRWASGLRPCLLHPVRGTPTEDCLPHQMPPKDMVRDVLRAGYSPAMPVDTS